MILYRRFRVSNNKGQLLHRLHVFIELFGSLECHTSPLPNPWGRGEEETFEFRAFYAVW